MSPRRLLVVLACLLVACGAPGPTPNPTPTTAPPAATPPAEDPPMGRLPSDVRPTAYRLAMTIDPKRDGFSGTVDIDVTLERPRSVIWLHGNGLTASEASITAAGVSPQTASYDQVTPGGVARLTVEKPLPAGAATIHIAFSGPYDKRLNGLYKVTTQGDDYAFTQMEPVWTRKAFPCFDEPAFKTPWTVSLTTPKGDVAIANTREIKKELVDANMMRHDYATTEPLPSYLIAFAVGPLDVVVAPPIPPNEARKEPLPFRGVAAKGRGDELAFALKHTPALLAELEKYFAIGYPYDKLDIIAVPDKGGAMENAGAVTFREWLLLLDGDDASTDQKRAFAYVMAHELAHQWFGNLVTMPWWDDIWLNEAFATWMGHRAVELWDPSYQASVRQLEGVYQAMGADSLLSARQIRQPVEDEDGIHSAFDYITYRKGGGVLGMFERWMGPEVFRDGLRAYMKRHRHGSATASDLMTAFSAAANKDVATPFNTFLMQPGLPNVHVTVSCESTPTITLEQSRFLPLGSKGDAAAQTWRVPVCLRLAQGKKRQEECSLLSKRSTIITLDQCPDWVMPNAGGAGYYQWSADPELLRTLTTKALGELTVQEKMSLAKAVRGMLARGVLEVDVALAVLEPLARDDHPSVAGAPMSVLGMAASWLYGDPLAKKAEARIRSLYAPRLAKVGWTARPKESPETKLLRRNLIQFVALAGEDPTARGRATRMAKAYLGVGGDGAIHKDAIDADLVGTILYCAGQHADQTLFEALLHHFDNAPNAAVRGDTLAALSAVRDAELQQRVHAMLLGDGLKVSERMIPLRVQMQTPETREATWRWVQDHVDELMEKLSARRAAWLPGIATNFCDAAKIDEVDALFEPRLTKMSGGAREVAMTTEALRTCSAKKDRLLPGLKKLLR